MTQITSNLLRSRHGQITVQLFTLASLVCRALAECGNLVVFDGDVQIDSNNICIKRYKTSECFNFVKSYDKNDLPADYPKSEIGVDKPEDFHLVGTETINGNIVYPGISIRWKPPKSDHSRDRLVGFLIIWHHRTSNVSCNLLLLNTSSQELKKELNFQYNIRVHPYSFFTVEVHSMPTFPIQHTDKFAVGSIATPRIYSIDLNPANWVPFITYNVSSNGTLVVRFTLAPLIYKLRKFEVNLVDVNDPIHPIYTSIIRPPPLSETNTHAVQSFQVNQSGCYNVVITVLEEEGDYMVSGRCSCWIVDDHNKLCVSSCGNVFKQICMNVTASDPATDTLDGATHSTSADEPHKQRLNRDLAEAIAGGLVAAFLFLMLIFCVAFCLKHGSSVCRSCKKTSKQQAVNVSKNWSDFDPDFTNMVPLTEKTVYIIYAKDHQPHVQLVESFIAFLNAHCCCRVISLMQCDCDESEMYQWFLAKISTADYIIFLNSRAAEHLIVDYLNNSRNRQSTMEDDFFQLGVKFLMNSEEIRDKNLILVSFKGKCCQKYFQVSTVYTLPKDLLGFLQKLHNLKGNAKAYDDWLPLHVENIPNLPEGARLLSAIKVVEVFEERNPGWLEKSFGSLKLVKSADDSSDVSSISLVPTQDLTLDEFDRPVPVFKELDFPTCLHTGDPQNATAHTIPRVQSSTNNKSYYPGKKLNGENLYIILNNLKTEDTIPWYQDKLTRMGHIVNLETKSVDGESLNPPETLSEILYDTYSTALAQINTNGELIYLQSQVSCVGNSSSMKSEGMELNHVNELKLNPPETVSNIQEENISAIFRAINANTESCLNEL